MTSTLTRWQTCAALLALALTGGCDSNNGEVFQGYAEGEFVRVAAPYAGMLAELKVQRGAQVNAAAPLFVLEQENERAARGEAEERLRQAEAQLGQAQRRPCLSEANFRRDQKLAATGFISSRQLDTSRAALDRDREQVRSLEAQARASGEVLRQAEWKLAQKSVNAPVAGLVQDTLYVLGEWVPGGSPVVSLLPPENIKVRFFVPEQRLAALRVGQAVTVNCDKCGASMAAHITYIAPQAEYTPPVIYSKENRDKLVFLIEAKPAPADAVKLHPGQPVDVRL
jgi:HlyD family secretion protein